MFLFEGGSGGSGGAPAPTPAPQPTTPPAPPPEPTTPPAPQPTGAVPLDRFREVDGQRKSAETRAQEAEARLAEIEAQNLSEVEKANRDKAKADEKATGAESRAIAAERKLHVTLAATAKHVDPEIAVAMLGDAEIADAEQANAALDALIERKPSIVDAPGGGQPTPFGRPGGGVPGGAPPSSATPANGETDDPKLALGQGLLGYLTGRGAPSQ